MRIAGTGACVKATVAAAVLGALLVAAGGGCEDSRDDPIVLSTSSLSFVAYDGWTDPPIQSVTVTRAASWSSEFVTPPSWATIASGTGADGESFSVVVSTGGLGSGTYTAEILVSDDGGALSSRSVTVTLDLHPYGELPTVSVTSTGFADEAGGSPAEITVQRDLDTLPLEVTLAYGGSTVGADHDPLPTSVSLPAGVTSASFPVTAVDDSYDEGVEFLIVYLAGGAAYREAVGSNVAEVAVLDNDHGLGDGLVGHWQLDESLGTVVYDASPNRNHGTLIGGTWALGHVRGCISLSGAVGDRIDVMGIAGVPDISEAKSMAYWMNHGPTSKSTESIVSLMRYMGPDPLTCSSIASGIKYGDLRAWQYYGTGKVIATLPPSGEWHHVVYTYDGAGGHKLYLDGTLVDSSSSSVQSGPPINFHIGAARTQSSEYFDGMVDDVRIYDRPLTPTEVSALASQ